MTELGAAAALADARAARANLAQKLKCPPWAHAAFGALYAVLVAAMGAPEHLIFWIQGAVIVAVAVLFVTYRRRLGFFVNGYRKGRTRPVAFGVLAAYLVCFSLAFWMRTQFGLRWPAFALAAPMFAIGWWASVTWNRIYRAELAHGLGA